MEVVQVPKALLNRIKKHFEVFQVKDDTVGDYKKRKALSEMLIRLELKEFSENYYRGMGGID